MNKNQRQRSSEEIAAADSWQALPDVETLFSLHPEKRYQLFVLAVRKHNAVWILESEAARPCIVQAAPEYLPVFPSAESALAFSKLHPRFKPRSLTLDEFIQLWLPGLARDGINVGVVPNLAVTLLATHPLSLREVLES